VTGDNNARIPVEVLEAFELGGAPGEPLPGGHVNRHWRVVAGGGTVVIQRHGWRRNQAGIAWERGLTVLAGERGWPVPLLVRAARRALTVEAEGTSWTCHAWLEGETRSGDSPGWRNIQGRLLARLHRDIASFEAGGQRPGSGKTWELDALVEPAGSGSFNALVAELGREYPELAAGVRRQRYRSLRELSRLRYPDLPEHPIHGDFSPGNLLFRDGRLTGVLDFEFARRDAWVCDLAPLVMPFGPLEPRLAAGLFEGYQAVRQLTEQEWTLLPALVRASLLWWVAVLLVRWRVGGGEPDGIARTIGERFPAFDAYEPELRALGRRALT